MKYLARFACQNFMASYKYSSQNVGAQNFEPLHFASGWVGVCKCRRFLIGEVIIYLKLDNVLLNH